MLVLDIHFVSLSYLVRWLHVASMAGLFGGAILILLLSLQSPPDTNHPQDGALLAIAQTYEWLFWLTIGLLVMTGVGNLAAFGAALPAPETAWGGKLTVKLAVVGAFALLSLLRTLLVISLGAATGRGATGPRTILGWAYACSVLLAAAIVAIAVWLAHG